VAQPSGEGQMIQPNNPFASMPRCGAKTRAGKPCRRIGNKRNGRCKLHGGRAGAPSGERNGAWRHGGRAKEAIAQQKAIRALLRDATHVLRRDK
jgi:hypothetical protein